MGSVPDKPSVVVLIDYQNVHLIARDLFAPPGTDTKDTLVDPLAFAERVIEIKSRASAVPCAKGCPTSGGEGLPRSAWQQAGSPVV